MTSLRKACFECAAYQKGKCYIDFFPLCFSDNALVDQALDVRSKCSQPLQVFPYQLCYLT